MPTCTSAPHNPKLAVHLKPCPIFACVVVCDVCQPWRASPLRVTGTINKLPSEAAARFDCFQCSVISPHSLVTLWWLHAHAHGIHTCAPQTIQVHPITPPTFQNCGPTVHSTITGIESREDTDNNLASVAAPMQTEPADHLTSAVHAPQPRVTAVFKAPHSASVSPTTSRTRAPLSSASSASLATGRTSKRAASDDSGSAGMPAAKIPKNADEGDPPPPTIYFPDGSAVTDINPLHWVRSRAHAPSSRNLPRCTRSSAPQMTQDALSALRLRSS